MNRPKNDLINEAYSGIMAAYVLAFSSFEDITPCQCRKYFKVTSQKVIGISGGNLGGDFCLCVTQSFVSLSFALCVGACPGTAGYNGGISRNRVTGREVLTYRQTVLRKVPSCQR